MGNRTFTKPALQRLTTFVAALGMLTLSSGVALMVSAGPAHAANKVGICHATSSDTNPYVFISVDDDSAKLKGHLQHLTDPNKQWKSEGSFNGVPHQDGDAKRDLIGSFTDDQDVFHEHDGDITEADCNGEVEITATADVELVQPDCDNQNTPSFESLGENVVTPFAADGPLTPGTTVTITATAVEGATFDDESTTMEFEFVIGEAEADCDIVSPPDEVTPVAPEFVEPTCASEAAVILPEASEPAAKAGDVVQTGDVNGVHYEVSGDVVPGGTVEVTAAAIPPSVLAEGSETFWTYTFAELVDCSEVAPPSIITPTVTPTVVSAGLTAEDLRGGQGLVLLVVGMILMVVAGGLSVVRPGGAVRS